MQIHIETKDAFDWLDPISTILSVILGAALAYLGTRFLERLRERRERIAKATLLALKFRNVVDGIFKIDRQLREGMENATRASVEGPAWAKFEEISAIGDYEEVITVEDMSVLAEGEHYDLIEEISELRDGHNGVVRALAQVFRLREELAEAMPPTRFDGNVASFEGEPSPKARMLLIRLDTLTDSILKNIEELKDQAIKSAPEVHRKLKASLKVKRFPLITVPENAPEARGTEAQVDDGAAKADPDSRLG
jgi:hypothetical protein